MTYDIGNPGPDLGTGTKMWQGLFVYMCFAPRSRYEDGDGRNPKTDPRFPWHMLWF